VTAMAIAAVCATAHGGRLSMGRGSPAEQSAMMRES
jgi:hypothetical protein